MIIYRVEWTDGQGPYRWRWEFPELASAGTEICSDHGWGDDSHPSPQDEGLIMEEGWYCGFDSEEKLVEWFTAHDWLRKLADLDYRFVAYDAADVQVGRRQVIFNPQTAEKIMDEPLDTLVRGW